MLEATERRLTGIEVDEPKQKQIEVE